MESFAKKFNNFDLFSMLIPGIITCTLFGISLSFKWYDTWVKLEKEKYVAFFIISYLCGVFLHEMGAIVDDMLLCKLLYGGRIRRVFLLRNNHKKILEQELYYTDAIYVRDHFVKFLDINNDTNINIEQEEILNSRIFSYCLNILEMNKLTEKSNKMIAISEMSRSLLCGCLLTIFLNLFMIFKSPYYYKFYCIEIFILIIAGLTFLYRKIRYEKYMLRVSLRTFFIYNKQNEHGN